ncbi:hypothetical protein ACLEEZ_10430 [Lonsdalea quercina]|uniref:hypothetical protein n=1 Tax=Lonsdalea quercina TaxID=71657 RepID=UPI0039760B5D
MKKRLLAVSLPLLLTALTGCSTINDLGLNQLNTILNPVGQQETSHQAPQQTVQKYSPMAIPVDAAAFRLKHYYGFVSDTDIASARDSGQRNAGWSASSISEGTGWEALPGIYYRMSRNWTGNDRLTLEVSENNHKSVITATYTSANPDHLKPAWTSRLWKQIPDVAQGKTH